jgi:hypothetical protein
MRRNFSEPEDIPGEQLEKFRELLSWPSELRKELLHLVMPNLNVRNYVPCYANAYATLRASVLLRLLVNEHQIRPDAVITSGEGGVGICWPRKTWYFEFECENFGPIWIQHRERGQKGVLEEFSFENASTYIETLKTYLFLEESPKAPEIFIKS